MKSLFGDRTRRPLPNAWTKDEMTQLCALAKSGMSQAEVAEHLGRTRGAVKAKSSQLNIRWPNPRGKWSEDEVASLREYAKKYTMVEVARLLGRSYSSVHEKTYFTGIKFLKSGAASPRAKLSESQVEEIFALYKDGWSLSKLATRYGVKRSTIWSVLNGGSHIRQTMKLIYEANE